jgi:hypothetical protein
MYINRFYALIALLFLTASVHAAGCDNCCGGMSGIHYCDSSVGRYVCRNGNYSSCYCTRHAVMDLQKLQGCCLWAGGVLKIDPTGLVICNNGGVSEICSLKPAREPVASF